ncbi:MAG: MEDS domain-containing protein [Actinobacteria bacterium]|nr:MEDS domain-containing protein [Actinomycetota bacterium]
MTSAERLQHQALHYRSTAEYVAGILSFVRTGAASGEPAFVAVPEEQLDWVRPVLGEQRHEVRFADMSKSGATPAVSFRQSSLSSTNTPGAGCASSANPYGPAAPMRKPPRHLAMKR